MTYSYEIRENEYWWGGSAGAGASQPYDCRTNFSADYRKSCSNQGMPLYLSSQGRYLWSEEPFAVTFANGTITLESDHEIIMCQAGNTLRDAYLAAMQAHFPFTGKVPEKFFFSTAQYNSWMEFTFSPTQEGILAYAHAIIDNGFLPGIFIIDEGWHHPYGDWTFDGEKFPDPRAMIDELHALGFKVLLWVVPFVSCASPQFSGFSRREINPDTYDKRFMRTEEGNVALVSWWNGYSALLDMTNPLDVSFMEEQLRALMDDYGVDGFKFDGGAMGAYHNDAVANGNYRGTATGTYSPMAQNIAWNEFGGRFPYHEYKDTFKGGGKPTIQRLKDRDHSWTGAGINTIVPNSLLQGLLGYPFICPDMIGGGEWSFNYIPGFSFDEELFVRMAQVSVFFPMMQFSWAPWRLLSPEALAIVRDCSLLHAGLAEEMWPLIRDCAATGEPIIRHLEYEYPGCGYEKITDQYLCGSDILVCPVVTKGTREKDVVIPPGKWADTEGNIYGQGTHRLKTPLEKLLYFRRIK